MAVVLHRTVAGRVARERMQRRRDRAIRAARRKGVPIEELAAGLGLSQGWIRQVLAGKKVAEPAAVEEPA
jgi:transcriptional regulator with XRE-family HTH domain